MTNRKITVLILVLCFSLLNFEVIASENKYPDYADLFLGPDKHENFNRKMFDFNYGLNLFLIKPIHIIWSSVMPK
ncbi:VacJ family lipoprotein, partial [bacterium]|nr:VacJ family lipoprotein [bacterium]